MCIQAGAERVWEGKLQAGRPELGYTGLAEHDEGTGHCLAHAPEFSARWEIVQRSPKSTATEGEGSGLGCSQSRGKKRSWDGGCANVSAV